MPEWLFYVCFAHILLLRKVPQNAVSSDSSKFGHAKWLSFPDLAPWLRWLVWSRLVRYLSCIDSPHGGYGLCPTWLSRGAIELLTLWLLILLSTHKVTLGLGHLWQSVSWQLADARLVTCLHLCPRFLVLGESWSEPGAKGSVQGLLGHPRGLGPLGDSKRDLCRKELSCCILLICKHMLIISLGIG